MDQTAALPSPTMNARRRIFNLRAGSGNPISIMDAWELVKVIGLLRCMSPDLRRFSDAGTHDANHAFRRPASEKRQGTKSRWGN